MQRILFIETCNSSPHLETTLEIAKKHLNEGDLVYYDFIGHVVPYNDFPKPPERFFFLRSSPEKLGIKLINNKNLLFNNGEEYNIVSGVYFPEFKNIKELKKYEYKGFKAGLACASSLISRLRLSEPSTLHYKNLVERILLSGISTYEYTLKTIRDYCPDCIYIFNGRFINNRAMVEAAIESNIPYYIHERGANKTKYSISDHVIHDMQKIQDKVISFWNQDEIKSNRIDIGKKFFIDRKNRVEQGWTTFTKNQKKGLGINIDLEGRKLIAYFASSNDEYAAVGDIVNWGIWENQNNAVEHLIDVVSNNKELFLAIRLHPHLINKHSLDLKKWLDLKLPTNAMLMMPDDDLDTYTLIEQASIVVTCGSTVGIESVFWGTPSITIGPSLYSKLGADYLPKNREELKNMILSNNLVATREATLPYGYYFSSYGTDFTYYKPHSLFSGEFLGVNLQKEHFVRKIRNAYHDVRTRIKTLKILKS
jgi:hypothetical protein